MSQAVFSRLSQPLSVVEYLQRKYLSTSRSIWGRLPLRLTSWRLIRAYGLHVHKMIQCHEERWQRLGTFFFRNRSELQLLIRLLGHKRQGSTLDVAILACSKGAEVYSFSYAIRCGRPDLNLRLRAMDIDEDVLRFAAGGTYSLVRQDAPDDPNSSPSAAGADVAIKTYRDQHRSIFERMSSGEREELFDQTGTEVKVKARFRDGITWQLGDAGAPDLSDVLGFQDIVVANRFLCHMHPDEAERCLRNLARLVKPGGYLFVSGVDLGVRSKVARELGWEPVTESIQEIHEGDPSLRRDWPLEYWGLEPFDQSRVDWKIRYASVFRLGGAV
jgi:chemotaxis methyl-accepting protein methylase